MRYQRARWLGLALGALFVLSACSARAASEPVSVTTPYGRGDSHRGAVERATLRADNRQPAHNDLKKARVTRSLKAGAVKLNRQVLITKPCPRVVSRRRPTPDDLDRRPQPNKAPGQYTASTNQKIYLSRLTAYLDVSDPTGYLDSPDPLIDKADITPGFFVTTPSSYSQVFALPSLPDEATRLTIEFSYEMLVLQSNSTPRDFSKRTATDTLVISLP